MSAVLAPPRSVKIIDATHELYRIPEDAIRALAAVELSGWDDMYERERVLELAASLGHAYGSDWLRRNRHLYFVALRRMRSR